MLAVWTLCILNIPSWNGGLLGHELMPKVRPKSVQQWVTARKTRDTPIYRRSFYAFLKYIRSREYLHVVPLREVTQSHSLFIMLHPVHTSIDEYPFEGQNYWGWAMLQSNLLRHHETMMPCGRVLSEHETCSSISGVFIPNRLDGTKHDGRALPYRIRRRIANVHS